LPSSFPENYKITTSEKGKEKGLVVNYPCVVLNKMVVDHNTNEQYQTMTDPVTRKYETKSECSIEFEVDGPYKVWNVP
jgi:DNA polymerase epsilon subunit 1